MKPYLPLLTILLSLFFGVNKDAGAQTSLYVQPTINPAECNSEVTMIHLNFDVINPALPYDQYMYCLSYGDGNPSLDCHTPTSGYPYSGVFQFTVPVPHRVMRIYLVEQNTLPLSFVDSVIIYIDSLCQYNVTGSVHVNQNNSCTDGPALGVPFKLRLDSNGVPADTITGIGGYGYLFTPPYPDTVYTLTPINLPEGAAVTCPSSGNYTFTTDTISQTLDFGLSCNATGNFNLFGYVHGRYRTLATTVSPSFLYLTLGNNACSPQNVQASLTLDPAYSYVSASMAPTAVSGQVLTWNISNMSAATTAQIYVTIAAGSNVSPGGIACSDLVVSPTAGDTDPGDNGFTFCDTIRGSWDPNDKSVSPAGNIAPGTQLTYNLNFENTGNDTAYSVFIVDTLSQHLDLSSFELLSSSHPVRVTFTPYPSGKIARFQFPGIRLTGANHPEGNKGFVMYKIRARSSMVPGMVVENTGHIYFDNNEPVVTNTTHSPVPEPNSIQPLPQENDLRVFPNPASSILYVQCATGHYTHACLVNALGQTVLEQTIVQGTNTLHTSLLAAGTYYLRLNGDQKNTVRKITIQ